MGIEEYKRLLTENKETTPILFISENDEYFTTVSKHILKDMILRYMEKKDVSLMCMKMGYLYEYIKSSTKTIMEKFNLNKDMEEGYILELIEYMINVLIKENARSMYTYDSNGIIHNLFRESNKESPIIFDRWVDFMYVILTEAVSDMYKEYLKNEELNIINQLEKMFDEVIITHSDINNQFNWVCFVTDGTICNYYNMTFGNITIPSVDTYSIRGYTYCVSHWIVDNENIFILFIDKDSINNETVEKILNNKTFIRNNKD